MIVPAPHRIVSTRYNRNVRRIESIAFRSPAVSAILMAVVMLVPGLLPLAGCSYVNTAYNWMGGITTGMRIESISSNPVHIATDFPTAVCATDPHVDGTIWLTDIPMGNLTSGQVETGQILHIELLWTPRPGYTPIDYEATNISVRYIVISNGKYGIYEGGGFGYPLGSPDSSSMVLNIEGVTLQLAESTDGFIDLLSPAVLTGTFNGSCDTGMSVMIRDATSQLVTDAFGRTMFVRAD